MFSSLPTDMMIFHDLQTGILKLCYIRWTINCADECSINKCLKLNMLLTVDITVQERIKVKKQKLTGSTKSIFKP